MANILNLHLLHTTPVANLNRDQAGIPKTAMLGGVLRNRISSQARKRPIRIAYETEVGGERTSRSKLFAESDALSRLHEALTERGVDLDATVRDQVEAGTLPAGLLDEKPAKATKKRVTVPVPLDVSVRAAAKILFQFYLDQMILKPDNVKARYDTNVDEARAGQDITVADPASDDTGDTLMWFAESELAEFVAEVTQRFHGQADADPLTMIEPNRTRSLAIAAFGRMFAQRPELQTHAAVQVAHSIGTHAYLNTADYYTAVDDLSLSLHGHAGAGHIAQTILSSATLYSHLAVDLDQLARNWITPDQPEAAHRHLTVFYREAMLAMPKGMANSTAPTTIPDYVSVIAAPRRGSFAPAFDAPIAPATDTSGGYITGSIHRLKDYTQRIQRFAPGTFDDQIEASILDPDRHNLDEIISFCVDRTVAAIAAAHREYVA